MNPSAAPALPGAIDPPRAAEQLGAAVEGSLVSLPGLRPAGDGRGFALGFLAVLAAIFALSWAQAFMVPLLLGVVITYTLNPLVSWLEAIRIPRLLGTAVVIVSVVGMLGLGTYALRGQMQTIVEQVPEAAAKVATGLARMNLTQTGNLKKMQSAAAVVEKATKEATDSAGAPHEAATHVVVDQPTFRIGSFLWASSRGALGVVGQAAMVVFLVFFLLVGGDTFKRKLVRLSGPSLSKRKITVHILDDINSSIQKYMLMLLVTNLLVALLTWMVFRWIGLQNAGAWAVAAGLMHIVPYLGPGVTAVAAGMTAYVQFESFGTAFLVAGASLGIATVVGSFVTTWMTGRIANMNPAAVFISLLFWGWLWGIWGMLLSVPLVVIAKVLSEHVEDLHPLAELLGE